MLIRDNTLLSTSFVRSNFLFLFINENISAFKYSIFEVRAANISLIYCSDSFKITYNTWDELRFVSYLQDKLYAELNINLGLSENSFIKLSIFGPIIELH